jgi:hypothetical protein
MLAKVQQFPSQTPSPADQHSIMVTFDPTAAPGSQFTFDKRFLLLGLQATVSVTLVTPNGGAMWASVPVSWPNPPSNGVPAVTIQSDDPMTISFQAPAPTHYFDPWIFTLNLDSNGLRNIMSPALFLVILPILDTVELALDYGSDGSFNLIMPDSQAVLTLASQQILINVLPVTLNISLKSTSFPDVIFNQQQPVIWGQGTPGMPGNPGPLGTPQWLTILPNPNNNNKDLTLTLAAPINGQSAGFQFAVNVNGLTVLSPDPIIINATIGDG